MNFDEYTLNAERTTAECGNTQMDNIHYTMGIVTEAGELIDIFKKNLAYNREIDWTNVKEEIGDLLWYLANFCRINKIDIHKVMETNIAKLRARYPEKYDDFHANNRDLTAERSILES